MKIKSMERYSVKAVDNDLEKLVAAGDYFFINGDLESVVLEKLTDEEIWLFMLHFDQSCSSKEVIKAFKKRNLSPAGLIDLLCFGVAHPVLQMSFPIIALGLKFKSNKKSLNPPMAYLSSNDNKRSLGVGGQEEIWSANCRFLAKLKKENKK